MYGNANVKCERAETDELSSLLHLVSFIGDNIRHFCTPLPEIYADFSDVILSDSGFTDTLRREGMAAAVNGKIAYQGESVRALMCSFASKLGGGSREDECALCEYTRSALGKLLDEREKTAAEREKLWRFGPILVSLAAILLLI